MQDNGLPGLVASSVSKLSAAHYLYVPFHAAFSERGLGYRGEGGCTCPRHRMVLGQGEGVP